MENGHAERTCFVIYSSGRYRMEKSSQYYNKDLKAHVFEDAVEAARLQDLKQILDATELKDDFVDEGAPSRDWFHEGERTSVAIPRESSIQQLNFSTYFETSMHGTNVSTQKGNSNVIKPLRKWLKSNVENQKPKELKDAIANGCGVAN